MDRRELVERIRERGVRPRLRMSRLGAPESAASDYNSALQSKVLDWLWRRLQEELVPVVKRGLPEQVTRTDAVEDDIARVLRAIGEEFGRRWTDEQISRLVQPFAQRVERAHKRDFNRMFEWLGVDVVGAEPWLREALRDFVRENVQLIKSLPQQMFPDIERNLNERIAKGQRWESLQYELEGRFGVARSRAKVIARDQVGKLYGNLNQTRQQDLGIDRYVWRTVRDNRVRDAHESRNGRVFRWSNPPKDGHPGEPVQCRCFPEPYLEPLLREAESAPPETQAPRVRARPSRVPEERNEDSPVRVVPQEAILWSPRRVFQVRVADLDDVPALAWHQRRTDAIVQAMRTGVRLPPITVRTGRDGSREVEDGNHRLHTARTLGQPTIRVRFLDKEAAAVKRRIPRQSLTTQPYQMAEG